MFDCLRVNGHFLGIIRQSGETNPLLQGGAPYLATLALVYT